MEKTGMVQLEASLVFLALLGGVLARLGYRLLLFHNLAFLGQFLRFLVQLVQVELPDHVLLVTKDSASINTIQPFLFIW